MNPVVQIDETKLNQICRCCLTVIEKVDVIIHNLSSILHGLFSIEIRQDIPENVCKSCSDEIFRSCSFRNKVFESSKILNAVVLQKQQSTQQEVDDHKIEIFKTEISDEETEIFKTEIYDEEAEGDDYKSIKEEPSPISNDITELSSTAEFRQESPTGNDTIELSGVAELKECQNETPKIYNCACGETLHGYKTYIDHRKQIKHPKKARRRYPCTYCGEMFTTTTMKYHIFKHTKARPYSCETCGSAFSSPANLHRHQYKHATQPLICEICSKVLTYPQSLKEHMNLHSTKKVRPSRKRPPPVRSLHKCEICNKVFTSLQTLRRHLLRHGDKFFLCSSCGKTFYTKKGLDTHYQIHSGERPFSCDVCKKRFTQRGSLKIHRLIHTGEKPYVCEICAKSFTQSQHLKAHKVVHTEKKWFKCPWCDKKYRQYTSLIIHRRSHTGETPYKCDQCDRGFRHSSAMKKHRTIHFKNKTASVDDSKIATRNNQDQ